MKPSMLTHYVRPHNEVAPVRQAPPKPTNRWDVANVILGTMAVTLWVLALWLSHENEDIRREFRIIPERHAPAPLPRA